MIPRDVAAWHAAERPPRLENPAERLRTCRVAEARNNCQDEASTRARIPGGLADRPPHHGIREWSSQETHEHLSIVDQAEQPCEIRIQRIPENARSGRRVQNTRAGQ